MNTEENNKLVVESVEANKNCARLFSSALAALATVKGIEESFVIIQTRFPGISRDSLSRALGAGIHPERLNDVDFVELAILLSKGITAAPLQSGNS